MKRLLEAMDSMAQAEKKPAGPKFPGYWKGKDPASKAKDKMVGGCEESILKDLHAYSESTSLERRIEEAYNNFKDEEEYGPEFQAMVKRVGDKAKQGPLKTVWDPVKRVYKNVPVNQEKQVKEYGNAQNPDAQATTPGAGGSLQADKENDAGAQLGAAATQKNIAALKTIEPNLNPQLANTALAKTEMPNAQMSGAEIGQSKELTGLLEPALKDPQIGSQLTALLRRAGQIQKAK